MYVQVFVPIWMYECWIELNGWLVGRSLACLPASLDSWCLLRKEKEGQRGGGVGKQLCKKKQENQKINVCMSRAPKDSVRELAKLASYAAASCKRRCGRAKAERRQA